MRRPGPDAAAPARPEAVVAGHVCLDFVCRTDAERVTLEPGDLLEVADTHVTTGGAVSNTGLALQRLGVRTRLLGLAGDDPFADVLRSALLRGGALDVSGIASLPGSSTSYTLVLTPPSGERMFLHDPGANAAFDAGSLDLDALDGARLLHFGYPPLMPALYRERGAPLAELLGAVRARGASVSLDMAMPDPSSPAARVDWREVLRSALSVTDLFMPGYDELVVMLRGGRDERPGASPVAVAAARSARIASELAEEAIAMGARIVLLKMGAEGAYLRTADEEALRGMGAAAPSRLDLWAGRELWAPSLSVSVASTVGAGDATCAGFLAALLRDLPPEDALVTATAVGAFSVEARDAVTGVPSWDACRRRLAAGWPVNPLTVTEAGWRRPEAGSLWRGPHDRAVEDAR